MPTVKFYLGDGTGALEIEVESFAEFLRGPGGTCAFCHGRTEDWTTPGTPIGDYLARNRWADTCPCCKGAPS